MTNRLAAAFLAAISLFVSPITWAQSAEPVNISIEESQPLSDALQSFADQTDLQVIFFADIAEGKTTSGMEGEYAVDAALDALLADTGLSYTFIDDTAVSVQTAVTDDEGGDRDSKNLSSRPTLMAQATAASTSTASENRSTIDDNATSVVTGRVTGARTGSGFEGALVKIEETGQTSSTNNLGIFRFPSVSPGRYTLRVSYLGYREIVTTIEVLPGTGLERNFAMTGGSELEEIVVYGARSARAIALNQERVAENFSTVLSADQLGQFNGTTISEALRRAPGIAFIPNPATGDGTQVIVRGLEPDLNQIQVNGLRLPEVSGRGRSPDLSGILTESIESVTISKTLLPNQDSNGAGALIEIETKSPLSRPARFVNLGVEYGERSNGFSDDLLLSGTLSHKFGSDESFGASVSGQYRDRQATSLGYELRISGFGQYLPAGVSSRSSIDPRDPFPFEDGVDQVYPGATNTNSTSTSDGNVSLNAALQKTFGDHTDLRLDVTYNQLQTTKFANTTTAGALSGYVLAPVDALGGEERLHFVTEDVFAGSGFPGILGNVARNVNWTPKTENETTTFSFRGETDTGAWELDYGLGYTRGESNTPQSTTIGSGAAPFSGTDPSLLRQDIRDNTNNGSIIALYEPLAPNQRTFVFPAFNQAGFDFYNDVANAPFMAALSFEGALGQNERYSANLSARHTFDNSWLNYVELGASYEDSAFGNVGNPIENNFFALGGANFGQLGLEFGPGILSRVGASGDFDRLTRASVERFFASTDALIADELLRVDTIDREQLRRTGTGEQDVSAWLQGRIDIGKLEIIGGLRLTQVDVDTTFFTSPSFVDENGVRDPTYRTRFGQVVNGRASQTDILPRVLLNYRVSDDMIFRGGYFNTVSRPQVINLTAPSSASLNLRPRFGPDSNQPLLSVSQGNPDLKPATTHNFDVSWEWYTDTIGVIKVSGFYKTIKNPLQSTFRRGGVEVIPENLSLPDTPEFNNLPGNIFVQLTQPVNGENSNDIWGTELGVERQLTFLPGLWSGLGVFANYTYTDSASDRVFSSGATGVEDVVIPNVPFDGSPKHSGTAALTYSKYGIDANLAYSWQARRLSRFSRNGLHSYDESLEVLDFRAEYQMEVRGANIRFYIEGNDLLRGVKDPYVETSVGGQGGIPKYFTGGSFLGGRSFAIGVSTTF